MDGVAWQEMAVCGDLGLGNVLDFAFAPNGDVWVATGMSLARFDGRVWQDMGRMVHSIAVAPDGALWATGWEGTQDSYYVARFDGVEWTNVLSSSLGSLQVTPDGVVWGAAGERGLARFDGQSWTFYDTAESLPLSSIGVLALAPDGALWASGQGGLAHFDGQDWTVYPAGEGVQALAFAPDGTAWLGTSNGAVHFQPTDE